MCVNTTTWIVWCYECDNEINETAKKKLLETVVNLRNAKKNKQQQQQVAPLRLEDRVGVLEMIYTK